MNLNRDTTNQLIIIIASALLFIPFLGNVHLFDWDEINFAESAREMIATGDYLTVQINFQAFWEKPPLFIWMQVLSMKIFGINEFAARFPNAIAGIATLLVLYNIGKELKNEQFGLLWAIVYGASILPHFYFKSGIIDPWFNLFIFLGTHHIIKYFFSNFKHTKNAILSAFFIGLGILTKGPVALLIFAITGFIFLISKKFKVKIKIKDIFLFIIVLSFTGGFWFILQILNGNYNIIIDFIVYQIRLFKTQDAGHGGFFGYHFVVLFLGVFPASIFALKTFRKTNYSTPEIENYKKWMHILFFTVLILFSIVKTKIVHYSSMCYFPLTFLGVYAIDAIINKKTSWNKWISILLIVISVLIAAVVSALQYVGSNTEKIIKSGIIKDKFATGNLQAIVNWSGFEFLIGFIIIGGIIFSLLFFNKNNLYKRTISIFIVTAIFTNLTILILVPKIEKYSQNAAIEFYKSKQNEDCYIETIGFKSYADLFYWNKQYPKNKNSLERAWLLTGDIDKTCYFVCKNFKADGYMKKYPELIKISEKNGFVFFKRKAKNK